MSTVPTAKEEGETVFEQSYEHKTVCHSAKKFVDGMAHTNGVESVGGLEAWFLWHLSFVFCEAFAVVSFVIFFSFE